MAANKFATMLHRNTNKITLILIYAILEWILIILLFLNSLFSYLIAKFADYFGLKRPCLWCARLDHIFEPQKHKKSYRDLVCETHASEISKLGYCQNHQKLAESEHFCEDCSSQTKSESFELSNKIAFFPLVKQISQKINFTCSCCGVSLESKFSSPYLLIKPSWDVLDYAQKVNLIAEAEVDDEDEADQGILSDFVEDPCKDEQGIEENRGIQMVSEVDRDFGKTEEEADEDWSCFVSNLSSKDIVVNEYDKVDDLNVIQVDQAMIHKDSSTEIPSRHLEFFIGRDDHELIPVKIEDEGNCANGDFILDFDMHLEKQVVSVVETGCSSGETMALLSDYESNKNPKIEVLDSLKSEEKVSNRHLVEREDEQVATAQATQTTSATAGEIESLVHLAPEEVSQMQSDEIEADISIGTEIPDQEHIDEIQDQDIIPSSESTHEDPTTSLSGLQADDYPNVPSYQCIQEDASTSYAGLHPDGYNDCGQAEEHILEFQTISDETSERAINNNHLWLCSEVNEIEEDKVPDTPTSIDSVHQLNRKLLLLERKESGTEESLDGSVLSDIEGGDGVLTIEKLKSALKGERKALNVLYAELEEERSASAVAANQTMAMINRLQEEKAAMQMEALQYQRMMDEQSEYDQEALQLLNELIVKREKEKQELEKELEMYRKKVYEYEAKEKMMMLRQRNDGSTRSKNSFSSCSNGEDSDGLSVYDLNHEAKEEDSINTPTDAVLYLEESLTNFEEERLSILEQLKVLEEKLFTMSDDDDDPEQHFEDVKPIEHAYKENGDGNHHNFYFSSEVNGIIENGHHKEMNGKHHQDGRIKGSKAKRLLPLFDATDGVTADGGFNGNGQEHEAENKMLIEEEVDQVYDRLQALEADREFLKHCIGSLRKGDKGIYLLQEILQHLRDLRSVDLRVRNISDGPL